MAPPFHVLNGPQRIERAYQAGRLAGGSVYALGRSAMAKHARTLLNDPVAALKLELAVSSARSDDEARSIMRAAIDEQIASGEEELRDVQKKGARLERLGAALHDAIEWFKQPAVLQGAGDSQFHLICDQNLMLLTREEHPAPPELALAQAAPAAVFLVQHDWAALLDGSEVDDGEYRLPFDYCVFEMEITGRRVCALVVSNDGAPYRLIPILRVRGGWLISCSYDVSGEGALREGEPGDPEPGVVEFANWIMAHVRAIAITLDAEVTQADVVRAPHVSGAAAKRGVRQAYDHHTLSLVRRQRVARMDGAAGAGSHKRLHFRRGHWRHYPNHKTWIKWMLVGDPSLGFADKDYRL